MINNFLKEQSDPYMENINKLKMLSTQQEFTAFENKVDEVMKILNSMSSHNQNKDDAGIVAANQ